MNQNQAHKEFVNHRYFLGIAVLLALAVFSGRTAAQDTPSTDRDNPTPFTSNVVTADGVDDKTEYFYSFPAGPGEVTLTLDVKAGKGTAVSSVDIALYDAKSTKLLSTYANPDHGSSKRSVESVKVRGTQTLLLEVTVSQGVDNFKIKLDGAVKITPPAGTAGEATSGGATSPQADVVSPNGGTAAGASASSPDPAGSTSNGSAGAQGGAQSGVAPDGSGGKTAKVNAKINSATSALTSIISSAASTTDSVKGLKKKKQ